MNEYQIWTNGAIFSLDEIYLPVFMADSSGVSFADACCRLAEVDESFRNQFDVGRMTYWGMSLHPTQREADYAFLNMVCSPSLLKTSQVQEYFSFRSPCKSDYDQLVNHLTIEANYVRRT